MSQRRTNRLERGFQKYKIQNILIITQSQEKSLTAQTQMMKLSILTCSLKKKADLKKSFGIVKMQTISRNKSRTNETKNRQRNQEIKSKDDNSKLSQIIVRSPKFQKQQVITWEIEMSIVVRETASKALLVELSQNNPLKQ